MCGKIFALVISNIFELCVNKLTADDKNSLSDRKNLPQTIQLHLSKTEKIFSQFFVTYLKCNISKSAHFEKKDDPYGFCISEISGCERRG